jgi:peptidoglycan hydrolase-like protein with peptidoglycan-binding domain
MSRFFIILIFVFFILPRSVFAITQTSTNGYILNGQINAITGVTTGIGGYINQNAGNAISVVQTSTNGYSMYTGGYFSPPIVDLCSNISGYQSTVPSGMTLSGSICSTPSSGGGGGGGGSIILKCPTGTTGVYPQCTVLCPTGTTGVYPACVTVVAPQIIDPTKNILCTDILVVAKPIKYGNLLYWNNPNDVKIVQKFLNTYEGENLVVDGYYSKLTFDAVVRWQEKYRAAILNPWGLKKGTGYVYLTSIAQMKRQQKSNCEVKNPQAVQPVAPVVTVPVSKLSCPYFTKSQNLKSKGVEVKKIQEFLNREVDARLVVDGNYDYVTQNAVRDFQTKYKKEILSVWNLQYASGWWYTSTMKKANELVGCK